MKSKLYQLLNIGKQNALEEEIKEVLLKVAKHLMIISV